MKKRVLFLFMLAGMFYGSVFAQTITPYAENVFGVIGIEYDCHKGWLWITQSGTTNCDGSVSVITGENQVYPFATGLPSFGSREEPVGPEHISFTSDGKMLVTIGGPGTDSLASTILVFDTTGFIPGVTPPKGRSDIEDVYYVGEFIYSLNYPESNPYNLTEGPDNNLYITDAAANVVVKRDHMTGDFSIFTSFPDIPNNTGIGPPFSQAVPTGIVFKDNHFFVSQLTGFPFADSAATIYKIDTAGNKSEYLKYMTTNVDLTLDPNNHLGIMQFSRFGFPPFVPNTGAVLRYMNGGIDTLVYGLNFPTALRFISMDEFYVSSLGDGAIYHVSLTGQNMQVTDVAGNSKQLPDKFTLSQNYPNPFNPATQIRYQLPEDSHVRLAVFDLTGQEVATLINEEKPAGSYSIDFNAASLTSGIYFYKIQAGIFSETRKMILMK